MRMVDEYQYKTDPYDHQDRIFKTTRDWVDFGLLAEMGTGKSKIIADSAAWQYERDKIDAFVVVAPNGVHRNWITKEVPAHIPDRVNPMAVAWNASMLAADRKILRKILETDDKGLRIFAMNVEAFGSTEKATNFLEDLFDRYRLMIAVDESTVIKTWDAKQTKRLCQLGKYAEARRILTGTPVTNSPMDLFGQLSFLNPKYLGFRNFYSFRARYAKLVKEKNHKQNREYTRVVGYQHLDELISKVDRICIRVTKKECLDLPEKMYIRRVVHMTKTQQQLYDTLKKESFAEHIKEGKLETMEVTNVLTKWLRLQQLLGGYMTNEDGQTVCIFDQPDKNPRLKELRAVTDEVTGKAIIWSRFRAEIDLISKSLRKWYGPDCVVEYHGGVKEKERDENVTAFQNNDKVRFFVGQPNAGGYGLTLTAANTVVYYSNDFNLATRLQSEDRAHRIGQKNPVTYVDLEVPGTIDTKILSALLSKKNVADIITRDDPTTWI